MTKGKKDQNKRESIFHLALIEGGYLKGSHWQQNEQLRGLLVQHGTLEGVFNSVSENKNPREINGINSAIQTLENLTFDFRTLTINDTDFPQDLRNYSWTVPVLYARGNLELLFDQKTVAVVGSRRLEDADRPAAADLMTRLLVKNYTIVSGLATGCDQYAHEAALQYSGGRTIAVLGTPLNIYGRSFQNEGIRRKMESEQLVVSQYPIGVKTSGDELAYRNATIVGLSKEGVVVMRVYPDSKGTFHSIDECKKQKKPLFVHEANLTNQRIQDLSGYQVIHTKKT